MTKTTFLLKTAGVAFAFVALLLFTILYNIPEEQQTINETLKTYDHV